MNKKQFWNKRQSFLLGYHAYSSLPSSSSNTTSTHLILQMGSSDLLQLLFNKVVVFSLTKTPRLAIDLDSVRISVENNQVIVYVSTSDEAMKYLQEADVVMDSHMDAYFPSDENYNPFGRDYPDQCPANAPEGCLGLNEEGVMLVAESTDVSIWYTLLVAYAASLGISFTS